MSKKNKFNKNKVLKRASGGEKSVGTHVTLYSVCIALVAAAGMAFAQLNEEAPTALILNEAYSELKNDTLKAIGLFEKAAGLEPDNVAVQRELGYLYYARLRYEESLRHFAAAESMESNDKTRLQMAYVLIALDRTGEARTVLKGLAAEGSPETREDASDQLELLPPSSLSPWWTNIYAAPYYDTRWETLFYFAHIRQGYYLRDDKKLSLFGLMMLSGDARSEYIPAPTLFSDNALILGAGLKAEPFRGLQFYLQQGIAFDLLDDGNGSRNKGDFRAIAIYNDGVYPNLMMTKKIRATFSPLLDLYSSLGYYSRYDNGIWHLQGKAGVRALEAAYSAFDIYAKGTLVRDTKKEFYNNILEGGFGARLIPDVSWGLYFMFEFQRGCYWDVGTSANPYDNYYNSCRFFVIFDRMF